MALTLVVEDGSGKSDSNTYISRTDADAYFEGRLNASDWTGASTAIKDAALVMAARQLDTQIQWNSFKSNNSQAMQWPRYSVRDPDQSMTYRPYPSFNSVGYIGADVIPQWLKDAQCEMARVLIIDDRTADPSGEGLSKFVLTGVMEVEFNLSTKRPVIPVHLLPVLTKYGYSLSGGGSVKLSRG